MEKELAINTLNSNAEEWLKFIIEDCTKYEIKDIRPKPIQSNSWLFFEQFNSWIGVCETTNNELFMFTIKQLEGPENWGIKLEEI